MQAQQVLTIPRRSVSLAVAFFATIVAVALTLALGAVYISRPAASAPPSVVVLHQDQTHAAQERADLIASERGAPSQGGPLSDLTRALPVASPSSAGSVQDQCQRATRRNVC